MKIAHLYLYVIIGAHKLDIHNIAKNIQVLYFIPAKLKYPSVRSISPIISTLINYQFLFSN